MDGINQKGTLLSSVFGYTYNLLPVAVRKRNEGQHFMQRRTGLQLWTLCYRVLQGIIWLMMSEPSALCTCFHPLNKCMGIYELSDLAAKREIAKQAKT